MQLDRVLLDSSRELITRKGDFYAITHAHGLYNTFQFVLRLSEKVHRKLAESPSGIVLNGQFDAEGLQAFSTYLHETIHWWQHVGSTYGLMLSLSYPTQAHANYKHLKNLLAQIGFKKPMRQLIEQIQGKSQPDTPAGLANIIVNNHFDIESYRRLTISPMTANKVVNDPLFESVGHAFQITYANNAILLGSVADPMFEVISYPEKWQDGFNALQSAKEEGFYYRSPVTVMPVGAFEIFEGQARFAQLQYLYFASDGQLTWDEVCARDMLGGVYGKAFSHFLKETELDWPSSIDHPTVGLFLLICDMAINPGSGFPYAPKFFASFIHDTDPGSRFLMLSRLVVLKCPGVVGMIQKYSRAEYAAASAALAGALLIEPPLQIAKTVVGWLRQSKDMQALMAEYQTFAYGAENIAVRVLFSHFMAFMEDKLTTPEFFCWPGAWMAGRRLSHQAVDLFDRHCALFVDKVDDDGVFPRIFDDRDEATVHTTFERFYAANISYDMTRQWIMEPGHFRYDYKWLSPSGTLEVFKQQADRIFASVYGANPDDAEILKPAT